MTNAHTNTRTSSERTYDDIPLGVVRVNSQRKISYANDAARALIGSDPVGTELSAFVDDDSARIHLEDEFRKRISGKASQYEIELTRPIDGRHVPVSISAAPEFDAAGAPTGSLAFLRDLTLERANIRIHRAIERETTMHGLLGAFCAELGKLIPFDGFRVTLVSEDRKSLSGLFEYPGRVAEHTAVKWWPMPPIVLEFLKQTEVHDLDLDEWFNHPEAKALARTDPGTRDYLKQGLKHVLVRPVLREDKVVAYVALETRNPEPYSVEQIRLCEQIPVSEVILSVLQMERRRELEFTIGLIREMGEVSNDISKVARILVERLQEHYGWEYVALFQVDEEAGVFRLLTQAGSAQILIREGYTQKLGDGLLGKAYNGGKGMPINAGDVRASDVSGTYVPGIATTRSEMCLPVPGGKLRWILNVEAGKQNAFANEEQQRVRVALGEVGFTLERAALRELKFAITDAIKDAVIQTNGAGWIIETNPAAAELFGAGAEVLRGKLFADLVDVDDPQKAVDIASEFPRTEVKLKKIDGTHFPALLSCARLPAELGGKVYVASDLSFQKRVEQNDLVKNVFWQVAQETRTPLALVSSWLRRAATLCEGEAAEIVDKSQRQLRKMDVTLSRVLRVASDIRGDPSSSTAIDLSDLVKDLLDELPHADALRVERAVDADLPAVLASRQDLEFCFHNLFGVMMRSGAQDDKLVVAAHQKDASVVLELKNVAKSPNRDAILARDRRLDPLRQEINSGLEVVKNTLERMGAELTMPNAQQNEFAIHLPVA